jgi:LysR family transcriptional regulator, transcriptional activator of the cysJI operon
MCKLDFSSLAQRVVVENFRLRVFRTVARHLNFSRAADELFLTQPAITQQVKALEEEIGISLFDRSGGRISLTRAGKVLLSYAEKMRQISDQACGRGCSVGRPRRRVANRGLADNRTIFASELCCRIHQGKSPSSDSNPNWQHRSNARGARRPPDTACSNRRPERRKDLRIQSFLEDFLGYGSPAGPSLGRSGY